MHPNSHIQNAVQKRSASHRTQKSTERLSSPPPRRHAEGIGIDVDWLDDAPILSSRGPGLVNLFGY